MKRRERWGDAFEARRQNAKEKGPKKIRLRYLMAWCVIMMLCLTKIAVFSVKAEEAEVSLDSAAAVLMEGSTGTILYEKEATKELRPASITKIMTLLLIFEALDGGQISLTDSVSVSEHAASMGGSQVYLEPYETQTVESMIKCISIASANDASVAMAEFVAGSEEAFVAKMNARAKELGMNHTHFVNCYGLDTDGHYSCALDVALMSRELIMNHPEISNYSTVWMDTIIHTTSRGQSEFGLTNTNKLIKSYQGLTGLKTGSTGLAKYCLSATARRDGMNLIAVIMAAPDTKTRFAEAAELLNYGYVKASLYNESFEATVFPEVLVKGGVKKSTCVQARKQFSYLCDKSINKEEIRMELELPEVIKAPVSGGMCVGKVIFYYGDRELGSVELLAVEEVEKAVYKDALAQVWRSFFGK